MALQSNTVKPDNTSIEGAGLGFRRSMFDDLSSGAYRGIDFLEVAPENWMKMGGRLGRQFRQLTEQYPFVTHGLSLSIGGPGPLDTKFLSDLKQFLDRHSIQDYTEHLSYCSDDGHLYDLMPIPFTEEAVHYVAARVREVSERLERRLALENVSFYAMPSRELSEQEFLLAVLEEADCDLLLDVNNIYVNSINHGYSASQFLSAMPAERVRYIHIAGHYQEDVDILVDTHGADVSDPVWALLQQAYRQFGVLPTLLERDFNLPPMKTLMEEVEKIRDLQKCAQQKMLECSVLPTTENPYAVK